MDFHQRLRRGVIATAMLFTGLLAACGGNDDAKPASVRFLNAVTDVGALSMYTGDDRRATSVPADSVSGYSALNAGSYDFRFKRSGSDSSLYTSSGSLGDDTNNTVVAWGRESNIRMTIIEDDDDNVPAAGLAKLRVLNGAVDAGAIDVYVAQAGADLNVASPSSSSVGVGALSGFTEQNAGSLQVRITSVGNRDEVRLEIPDLVVQERQVVTLVLQSTAGGTLVHAIALVQGGNATARKNSQSRVRLVSSVANNGVVAARVGSTVLSSAAVSPSIGSYFLVPSGNRVLLAQVAGNTVFSETLSFVAGQDYTVLVHGSATAAFAERFSDDNRSAPSSRAKLRLVHGAQGHDSLTMTVDSAAVASDLAYGSASSFVGVASNNGNALIEVTSPLLSTPLYTTSRSNSSTTGVSLEGTGVYTVFLLGGGSSPRGFLRRDR